MFINTCWGLKVEHGNRLPQFISFSGCRGRTEARVRQQRVRQQRRLFRALCRGGQTESALAGPVGEVPAKNHDVGVQCKFSTLSTLDSTRITVQVGRK